MFVSWPDANTRGRILQHLELLVQPTRKPRIVHAGNRKVATEQKGQPLEKKKIAIKEPSENQQASDENPKQEDVSMGTGKRRNLEAEIGATRRQTHKRQNEKEQAAENDGGSDRRRW